MKHLFTHDCDRCVLVGSITYPAPMWNGQVKTQSMRRADLYCCPEQALGADIIARFSDEGSDYSSMPASMIRDHFLSLGNKEYATSTPALIAGYVFAKAKGLV